MNTQLTNFPNGFPAGLSVLGATLVNTYGGNIFWVDSTSPNAAVGGPGTYEQPFTTIAGADSASVDNHGDIVLIKAGHSETFTGAAGAALAKAGVRYYGLGAGNDRPKFTFGTSTAASMTITGRSVQLLNVIGIAGIDSLLNPFNVTGDDVTLDIEWQDPTSLIEATQAVLLTSVDRGYVRLRYLGQTGGNACLRAIALNGCTGIRIAADFYGLASTAWVNFITTACTDITVEGYMYNSGTTNLSKDVVDTITGSTWFASFYDGAAGASVSGGSGAALASDDVSSIASSLTVATADGTANVYSRDVTGNKTDAAVYVPGTTNSNAAYAKGTADVQPKFATSATAVMSNGLTIFTISGGPVQVLSLISECMTTNDTTASTVQYASTSTGRSQQTISAASGSVASAALHATVSLIGTALSTAAVYNANGPNLSMAAPGGIVLPVGVISVVIGVGSTTGTWRHIIRYQPLVSGATVA